MEKLKIGLFIDSYYPLIDGVVLVVDNYAKHFKDVEVVVVCPYEGDYIDNFPYKIIRVNSVHLPLTNYRVSIPTLKDKQKLMNENFDIIHIHSPFTIGKLGIEIAKKNNIPVVGTMHTQFKKEFKRYVKNNFIADKMTNIIIKEFNKCDECWAVNSSLVKVFKDYGYKYEPKVMNNATDLILQDDTKEVDDIYKLNKNDMLFLFVGRITIIKNIMFILEVLKELRDRGHKFKMLFIGPSQDNELLQNKIDEYNLNNMVSIEKPITDRTLLAKVYKRAYLFLFPSLFDASSLVQIEAASQKTPTIFIEGSVTSGTIKKDETGFMAIEDVSLFADEIERIMKDKKLYKQVSENVYKYVYKNWDDVTKDALVSYKHIMKGRGK